MSLPTSTNDVTARKLSSVIDGLWTKIKSTFAKPGDITTAIQALDVSSVGGDGKYISAISETDGKISAISTTMDTTPTASSTKAVTSGGIKSALDGKSSTSHTHTVKINGTEKTIAASGGTAVDLGTYLTAHQTIKQDGVTGATVNRFGACSTAAGTAAKTVSITAGTYSLEAGTMVAVKFANKNTANSPTLNVGSTGAKNIFVNGAQITTNGGQKGLLAGTVIFIYDGTQYHLIGNYYDSNSTGYATQFSLGALSTNTVTYTNFASMAIANAEGNGEAQVILASGTGIGGTNMGTWHITVSNRGSSATAPKATMTVRCLNKQSQDTPPVFGYYYDTTNSLIYFGVKSPGYRGNNTITVLSNSGATLKDFGDVTTAPSGWTAVTITEYSATTHNHDSVYLKLAGGTMTGKINAWSSQYTDDGTTGAIDMKNSNIVGLNSLYTADASDGASEGIHFFRETGKYDTLWMAGGHMYFVPNRAVGTSTSAANSKKVAILPASITSGHVVVTDGTSGDVKGVAASTLTVGAANKATQDSDGNAINATYFKSSGNVTLVSGTATKIGTQNGTDVKLTLPTIPAAANNGALQLQLNGGTATSKFTANQSGNSTLAFSTGSTAGTFKVDSTEIAIAGFTKVESSSTNGNIKINGTETTVYTHPTTAGNKHIPAGGSSGQFLGWDSAGTAKWVSNPNSDTKVTQTADNSSTGTGFELLFSATADNTTRTEASRKSSKLTFQPSTGILTATRFVGLLDDSASRVGIGYTINAGSLTFNVDKTYAEIKAVISNNDRNNTYVSIRNASGGIAAGINNLLHLSSYDQSPNNTATLAFTGLDNNVLHYVTISSSDTVTYNRQYLVTSDSAQTSADFEPILTIARGVSKYLDAADGSIIGIHDDNESGGAGIYGIAFNSTGCVRWNGTSYVIQKITPGDSNGNQAHQFNGIASYAYNAFDALSASYATTAGDATNVALAGSVKTTSTSNGDTIQFRAGSGTAGTVTIVNAKHAASADSATSASYLKDATNTSRTAKVAYYSSGTITGSNSVQYLAGFYTPDGSSSSTICDVPHAKMLMYIFGQLYSSRCTTINSNHTLSLSDFSNNAEGSLYMYQNVTAASKTLTWTYRHTQGLGTTTGTVEKGCTAVFILDDYDNAVFTRLM
ncbi:MAG: hypothetical protein IKA48_01960 [Fibrobacter sp.]|nr:hypothetical protein [Fibrobacter sp.]